MQSLPVQQYQGNWTHWWQKKSACQNPAGMRWYVCAGMYVLVCMCWYCLCVGMYVLVCSCPGCILFVFMYAYMFLFTHILSCMYVLMLWLWVRHSWHLFSCMTLHAMWEPAQSVLTVDHSQIIDKPIHTHIHSYIQYTYRVYSELHTQY
jgi:hypothetical protein